MARRFSLRRPTLRSSKGGEKIGPLRLERQTWKHPTEKNKSPAPVAGAGVVEIAGVLASRKFCFEL